MITNKQRALPVLTVLSIALLLLVTVIVSNNTFAQATSRDREQRAVPVPSTQFTKSSVTTAPQDSMWARRGAVRTEHENRTARPTPPPTAPPTPVVVNTKPPTPKPVAPIVPVAAPVVVPPAERADSNATSFQSQFEQKVIEYTNIERTKEGLASLNADAKLAAIAEKHSADMLANDFFSHTNKSGCDTRCRLDAAQYKWQSYGENIQWMSGYTQTASEAAHKVVDGWLNSAGHRANILNAKFTHVGVGVDMEGTTIYTTADYALPK